MLAAPGGSAERIELASRREGRKAAARANRGDGCIRNVLGPEEEEEEEEGGGGRSTRSIDVGVVVGSRNSRGGEDIANHKLEASWASCSTQNG